MSSANKHRATGVTGRQPSWRAASSAHGSSKVLQMGAFLLLASAVALFYADRATRARKWVPVDMPLALSAGSRTEATFTADHRADYYVQVDLMRALPFEQLAAMGCPPVECTVTEDGRSVGQPFSGGYWGATVGFRIARFKAVAGKQYSAGVEVTRDASPFRPLAPRLRIEVNPAVQKRARINALKLGCLGTGLLAASLACLLAPIRSYAGALVAALRHRR